VAGVGTGRPRVLLGDLNPVVRLGLTRVLAEDGIDVVGDEELPQGIVMKAGRLRPDAVVLDLESRELGERVRIASPETTIVLWALDEASMVVLDPGSGTPRRYFTAVPQRLRNELRSSRPR
jgi:AmiR/NasT family two-component response regulator